MDTNLKEKTSIFKLVTFSPVAIKIPNYPNKTCPICRACLLNPCNACIKRKISTCDIIEVDNYYYHSHCHMYLQDQKSISKK